MSITSFLGTFFDDVTDYVLGCLTTLFRFTGSSFFSLLTLIEEVREFDFERVVPDFDLLLVADVYCFLMLLDLTKS
jgi:hypothetical protein